VELEDALQELDEALRRNEVITVFCSCTISYSGRAESELGEGERVIVIKQDNTVLVHQPTDSTPVNYMKDGSSIELSHDEDRLVLESRNLADKDYLQVEISDVVSLSAAKLQDGRSLQLVGTEEDMSDMIRDNPDEIGSWFTPVSREEHTAYGFMDVFGYDDEGRFVIVECKRYTAGVSAVQQLRRYVEKVQALKGVGDAKTRGVIAAPDVASNAKDMLQDWSYEHARVEPPNRQERFREKQQSLSDF
jgi:RecB family endonuclease NucS